MYLSFLRCEQCETDTDLPCCACGLVVCQYDWIQCGCCNNAVCSKCFKDELCCRQPRKKTKETLRNFYCNKYLDAKGLETVQVLGYWGMDDDCEWLEPRNECCERTVLRVIEELDMEYCRSLNFFSGSKFGRHLPLLQQCPKLRSLVDEMPSFVDPAVFAAVLAKSKDLEQLLTPKVEQILKSRPDFLKEMIQESVTEEPLFMVLRNRDLLNIELLQSVRRPIFNHVEGLKWLEINDIEVVKHDLHFTKYVDTRNVRVFEYLLKEKGMTLQCFMERLEDVVFSLDMMKVIHRVKGVKDLLNVKIVALDLHYESIHFLRRIGYNFCKEEILQLTDSYSIYAFLCFDMIAFEDMNQEQKEDILDYVSCHDIKICKSMLPLLKPYKKKQILMLVLCMKRIFGKSLPKEIMMKITDHAYSPTNQK